LSLALVQHKFEHIGARAKIRNQLSSRWRTQEATSFQLDVLGDRHGPYFDIVVPAQQAPEIEVLDVQKDWRHLLLMVRQQGRKDKFLCGHDERHWFACAVPERQVSNVRTAMEALKPSIVQAVQHRVGLKARKQISRRNNAFLRQGEWFFIPEPNLIVQNNLILRNEPIRRGWGSKAHRLEFAFRSGGDTVYVSDKYPTGLTVAEYQTLMRHDPQAKKQNFQVMKRDAGVYARGRVSHADHKTIVLHEWHRVLMNTESDAPAARNIAFLD
jgi:hypothetical protein